jgi:hypothetical protein
VQVCATAVWYSYGVLVICYRLFAPSICSSIEEEDSILLGCDAVMLDV